MTGTPMMRKKSRVDQHGNIRSSYLETPQLPAKTIRRSKSGYRWIVLLFSCFSMFGNYYCYDNPAALATPLKEHVGMSNFQFNMLYSIYSLPNTILPLFGGVFVDSIGVNVCLIGFTSMLVLGQSVFALGVSSNTYWIMLAGRLLYGMGGESLCVASSSLLAAWFRDKEMAFAMAVNLSVARLGSVANDNISPVVKDTLGLPYAMWTGACILGVCLILTMGLVTVDKTFVAAQEAKGYKVESVTSGERFECADILKFERIFWCLTASCVVIYGTVLPFNNIASDFFQDKYGYTESKANVLLGVPFIISAAASPFLGIGVDKLGRRAWLFLFAAFCLSGAHFMMASTDIDPTPFLVTIGSAYSIYAAAVWPGVALIVSELQLGTAYGLITSVQNFGLATFPLAVGGIRDGTGNYTWVEYFFTILGGLGIVMACILLIVDAQTGGRLNASSAANGPKDTMTVNEPGGGYDILDDDDLNSGPMTGALI